MRTILFLVALCSSAFAGDNQMQNGPGDKWLVWVHFAFADDTTLKLPQGMPDIVHSDTTLWISEKNHGDTTAYLSGPTASVRGGSSPDAMTGEKWLKCVKLFDRINEPNKLPAIPTRIVTISCLDKGAATTKKFPIEHLPPEVHQILTIMGFSDGCYPRLKFDK